MVVDVQDTAALEGALAALRDLVPMIKPMMCIQILGNELYRRALAY